MPLEADTLRRDWTLTARCERGRERSASVASPRDQRRTRGRRPLGAIAGGLGPRSSPAVISQWIRIHLGQWSVGRASS